MVSWLTCLLTGVLWCVVLSLSGGCLNEPVASFMSVEPLVCQIHDNMIGGSFRYNIFTCEYPYTVYSYDIV